MLHIVRRWMAKPFGYWAHVWDHTRIGPLECWRRTRRLLDERLRLERIPREQLVERQVRLLKGVLLYAGRTVPFYRRRFREAGFDPARFSSLSDLAQLPPLTKDDIRAHLDELVSEEADQRDLVPVVTGGGTGNPTRFYVDRKAWLHRKIEDLRGEHIAGWRPGEALGKLWGGSFDLSPKPLGRLRLFMLNRTFLDSFRLDDDLMAAYHARLSRLRPALLVGYTSLLLTMADWLERKGIKPSYPTAGITPCAEMVLPEHRRRLEAVYGAPIFELYGGRDCGIVAMECEAHNGLHINCFDMVLEPHGGAPGEAQELLYTSLLSYAMPLIRYANGDMAVFSDRQCVCGRTTPLLERIVGRVSDSLLMPDGSRITGMFFPVLLKDIPIAEFQIVQEEDYSLRARIVPAGGYGPAHENLIRERFARYVRDLPVDIEYPEAIERTRNGKIRVIVSKVAGRPQAQDETTVAAHFAER